MSGVKNLKKIYDPPLFAIFFFPKSIDETGEAFRLFDNQSSSKFSRAKVTDEGEISEGE